MDGAGAAPEGFISCSDDDRLSFAREDLCAHEEDVGSMDDGIRVVGFDVTFVTKDEKERERILVEGALGGSSLINEIGAVDLGVVMVTSCILSPLI